MVLEHVNINILPGQNSGFEQAMREARSILLAAVGCRSVSLAGGIESPARYILQVEWDSVDAHKTFGATEGVAAFRELIVPFLAGAPQMEHFAPLL